MFAKIQAKDCYIEVHESDLGTTVGLATLEGDEAIAMVHIVDGVPMVCLAEGVEVRPETVAVEETV